MEWSVFCVLGIRCHGASLSRCLCAEVCVCVVCVLCVCVRADCGGVLCLYNSVGYILIHFFLVWKVCRNSLLLCHLLKSWRDILKGGVLFAFTSCCLCVGLPVCWRLLLPLLLHTLAPLWPPYASPSSALRHRRRQPVSSVWVSVSVGSCLRWVVEPAASHRHES